MALPWPPISLWGIFKLLFFYQNMSLIVNNQICRRVFLNMCICYLLLVYFNLLLSGCFKYSLKSLQLLQKAKVRILTGTRRRYHVHPVLALSTLLSECRAELHLHGKGFTKTWWPETIGGQEHWVTSSKKRQNNHWWLLSTRAVELRPKNPLIDVWAGS